MQGESKRQRVERYIRDAEARAARYRDMVTTAGDGNQPDTANLKLLCEAESYLDALRRELERVRAGEAGSI